MSVCHDETQLYSECNSWMAFEAWEAPGCSLAWPGRLWLRFPFQYIQSGRVAPLFLTMHPRNVNRLISIMQAPEIFNQVLKDSN